MVDRSPSAIRILFAAGLALAVLTVACSEDSPQTDPAAKPIAESEQTTEMPLESPSVAEASPVEAPPAIEDEAEQAEQAALAPEGGANNGRHAPACAGDVRRR